MLTGIKTLNLRNNGITAAGLQPFAELIRVHLGGGGLTALCLEDNPIGDEAVQRLAQVLPCSLTQIELTNTGCADAGMAAIIEAVAPAAVAATPAQEPLEAGAGASTASPLVAISFAQNSAISNVGWEGLVDVVPTHHPPP